MTRFHQSLAVAIKGIKIAFREERNMRFHALAAVAVAIVGLIANLARWEWAAIIVAIGLVLCAEIFNTALEELCDMLRPIHDPHVAKIKDLSAGAVLLASIASAMIGLAVFAPHLMRMFSV